MKLTHTIKNYVIGEDRKKDFRIFMFFFGLMLAYGIAYQIHAGWYSTDTYVTTLLAFDYMSYGFFRRGLVGTLFKLVSYVIPSILSYRGAVWFMWGMNIIWFVSLIFFIRWMLNKIEDQKVYRSAFFISLICCTFLVPTMCYNGGQLGRADIIQYSVVLLQVYMLIEQKWEWLTIPLTGICVLFHEGYALMTFAAVLIVLIYRAVKTEGQHAKYWWLFAGNMIAMLIVAALSIKFVTSGTAQTYNEALTLAQSLHVKGGVHWNLMGMMSGFYGNATQSIIVTDDGIILATEIREIPIFLVCFAPALYLFGKWTVNLFKNLKGKKKGVYIAYCVIGPALVAIEYWKFCDYGRYVVWLVFIFFIAVTALAMLKDEVGEKALTDSYSMSNIASLIWLAVMMIYQPIPTCNFTNLTRIIMRLFEKQ